MPRRIAWVFFLIAVVLLFLATLRISGVSGLADWFGWAGLCSLAVGCTAWAFPYQPGPPAA
jgi:hypothetical protein